MASGARTDSGFKDAPPWIELIDGYKVTGPVARSSRSKVFAAVRERDGLDVLLKAYVRDVTVRGGSRAKRELDVLQRVAGEGVPRAIELIQTEQCPVLVIERVPGTSLHTWVQAGPPSLEACIDVGAKLADVLTRVHAAHIIHGDVTPANAIRDAASGRAHLIDFGIARPLGSASLRDEMHSLFEAFGGGLHFIAPEQANRMDRGVDTRSDLYSLGATLYYVLTGVPPFQCDEPLALIHAHMARMPDPLERRRADVPRTLGRIVLRLLEKEPEDRYASAELLRDDLLCCAEAIQAGRSIDELTLPSARHQGKLAFTRRLYGRELEMTTLRAALERARVRGPEIVLLSGPPGVGKSALVQELRRQLAAEVGYVIAGKFDLYRPDLPYAAFQSALQALALQMLAEPDARLAEWRTQLRQALGTLGGVVSEFAPDWSVILGEVSPVVPLGPKETRVRLSLAVERLIRGCASPEQPLVLFLDDLHWADAGSRALLLDLLRSDEPAAVLVIAAYRDAELTSEAEQRLRALLEMVEHASAPMTRIELTPLSLDAATQMLVDALGDAQPRVRELAACALRKTGGGPLLLQQFMLCMHERGYVRASGGRWHWNVAEIDATQVPEGAVGLLIAKLGNIAPEARELLQLAACIADQFDPPLLAELSARPEDSLHPWLDVLAREGLLVPSSAGFRFAHDRIREAAQLSLPSASRSALHYRIGRLLLECTPDAELAARCFEIADHLNRARECLTDADRPRVLEINVRAGGRALAAGTPSTALGYYRVARQMFRENQDWERAPAIAYLLFWEHSEALRQAEDYEAALEALTVLTKRELPVLQEAQVAGRMLAIRCIAHGPSPRLLEDGLRALRKFGIRWPVRPSWLRVRFDVLRTDWMLRGPLDERTFQPSTSSDRAWTAPLLFALHAHGTFITQSLRITFLMSALAVRIYVRHGTLHGPAYGLAAYAAFRASVRRDLEGMERYASAAERWLDRVDHGSSALRARFVLQAHVRSWIAPRRSLLEPLRELAERTRESGDLDLTSVISAHRIDFAAYAGEPLSTIVEMYTHSRRRYGFDRSADFCRRAYQLLHAPPASASALELEIEKLGGQAREQRDDPSSVWLPLIHWVHVLLFLGRFDAASIFAESLTQDVERVGAGGIQLADYTFLRGIAAATSLDGPRRARLRIARACLRQLRIWARRGPDLEPMVQLLDAELARALCKSRVALRRYEQAAQGSRLRGYVHHAALALERSAELLSASGQRREAAHALAEARALYNEWQAGFKLTRLGNESSAPAAR